MSEPLKTPADAPTGLAAVDALFAACNRSDAPGLVVGIAQHGRTVYRRGLGMASLEQGRANTPWTRMRIGSVSKHFTVLAALLLAEDGKLSIDDPVRLHLPELPALGYTPPTLRQLMSHTSGWRCHLALSFIAQGQAIPPIGSAMGALLHQSELNAEPGERMIYSNGGYHLLSRVIERVSGQDFARFMAERIFEPLGMLDTESVPSDFEIRPDTATLYQALPAALGGGWRRGIFPSEELLGEGAMVSSIDDMLRWLAHLRAAEKRVGSAASWAQMQESTRLSSGAVIPYGLGLKRLRYRGVEMLFHSGGVIGGASHMVSVPAHALDIMVMTNGAAVSPSGLALGIIDALLADALTEPPEERVPAAAHPALPGQRYHARGTGAIAEFSEASGKLGLAWLGMPAIALRPGPEYLWLGSQDVSMSPIEVEVASLGGDGPPDAITVREGGHAQRFERLPDQGPKPADLAPALCGAYHCPDLDASAQLELDGESLLLSIQGPHGSQVQRLTPWSADVLSFVPTDPLIAEAGGGIVNVDRAAGVVVGLRLDLVRVRHLRFVRLQPEAVRGLHHHA